MTTSVGRCQVTRERALRDLTIEKRHRDIISINLPDHNYLQLCVCVWQINPAKNNASCDTESVGDTKKKPMSYCLWPTVDLLMQNEKQWLPLYSIAACNVKEMRKVSCRGRTRFQQLKHLNLGDPKWKWQAPEGDRGDERCLQGMTEIDQRKQTKNLLDWSFNNIAQGSVLSGELLSSLQHIFWQFIIGTDTVLGIWDETWWIDFSCRPWLCPFPYLQCLKNHHVLSCLANQQSFSLPLSLC